MWLLEVGITRIVTLVVSMPKVGVEPTLPRGNRLLRPARLPFRHFGERWLNYRLRGGARQREGSGVDMIPLTQRRTRERAMSRGKVVVVDGNSLLYRALFALLVLTTADGTPTNAVYGFTLMIV